MEELDRSKPTEVVPNSNYKDKYVHLIGQDAAVEAAKRTESNKSYGFGMHSKHLNMNLFFNPLLTLFHSSECKQT